MMNKNLCEIFRHYEGQPVEIFTDDGRVHCGIDVNAYEGAVRLIDKCGRLVLIEYSHIDSVVEPQMKLRECCRRRCSCNEHDNDDRKYDDEDEYNGDYRGGNGRDCDDEREGFGRRRY